MPDSFSRTSTTVIQNARALLQDGFRDRVSIAIADGRIVEIGETGLTGDSVVDGAQLLLLPGIIDLHGDAFEREIAPRPGVAFPLDLAVEANDATLIANGITTFFYSITDGFEPGVRSRETVRGLMAAIEAKRPHLHCDNRIHIRHEAAAVEDHAELLGWISDRRIDLLSLNDHLPPPGDAFKIRRYIDGALRRVKMSEPDMITYIEDRQSKRALGTEQIEELAVAAHAADLALASHDERNADEAAHAARLGVRICEFPLIADCARAALDRGADVVMGAPNLVRGGSHIGGTSTRDEIIAGRVSVLVSDYFYPALLRAPFLLAELGILPLERAWDLVSTNPARAAGLSGIKGELRVGADADILGFRTRDGQALQGYSGEIALATVRGRIVLSR